MPIDAIRQRIEGHFDWLANALETDNNFRRKLLDLLDSIKVDGYDIRVTVRQSGQTEPIEIYRPRNSADPTGRPQDSRRTNHGSIECEVEAWRTSTPRLRSDDVDTLLREIGGLIGRHWGDRDSGTLLPYLKLPGVETRLLASVREAGATKGWVAVLHTDLDNFKAVNTEFREEGGDAVLKDFGGGRVSPHQ